MQKINITLKKGQRIFFTSDTHIGHKNILNFCQRPWGDIKSHNEGIIQKWNEVVGHGDIVFHLGDVCWFDGRHDMHKFMTKLRGTKYVVRGNHDTEKSFELCKPLNNFHLCDDTVVLYVRGIEGVDGTVEIVLNHYPLMTWSHRDRKAIQLFGHIHSGPLSKCEFDNNLPLLPYHYDVGCDNNNYAPIDLTDILKKINWPNEDPMILRKF